MKTSFLTIVLTACSLFLSAQAIDSVSAILIKYDVHLDIKESLAELQGDPDLKEFYYVIKDNVVFIKEVYDDDSGGGPFRCFDSENKLVYECTLEDHKIFVHTQSVYPDHRLFPQYTFGSTQRHQHPDSIQYIEGYPCKPVNVSIGGAIHEVWYTDLFGTHFSTIADIPGIPLYYEKTNRIDGKLRFRAVDIKPISVPAYYFDLENYEFVSEQKWPARTVYKKPKRHEPISLRMMDGGRVSTSDSLGKVMIFTFWRPEYSYLNTDMNTLNALQTEFQDDDVMFVAINRMSKKKAAQSVPYSGFEFPHIANADYLFQQYRIGSEPSHIIVDKRGYLRYRYSGIFGKPLYNSIKSDIESLLPSPRSNGQ